MRKNLIGVHVIILIMIVVFIVNAYYPLFIKHKSYVYYSVDIKQEDPLYYKISIPVPEINYDIIHSIASVIELKKGPGTFITTMTEKGNALQITGYGSLILFGRMNIDNNEIPPILSLMNKTIKDNLRTYYIKNEYPSNQSLMIKISLITQYYYQDGDKSYNYGVGGKVDTTLIWQEIEGGFLISMS